MEVLFWCAVLLAISIYHAWRYSKTSVDPDWAYFNLYAFTGSVYGRDFPDCKTPGVHLWYGLLAKLVGANVQRVKFANHALIGSVGVLLFLITHNFYTALAYTVLVNSGWLLAFHGNVGQVPAALISVALALRHPVLSPVLWLAAVLYEPKLLFSFVVAYWQIAFVLAIVSGIGVLIFRTQPWFQWLWESSVTIPARMTKARNFETWFPWFTSNPVLYILPWLMLAVYAMPSLVYWIPPLLYGILLGVGRAIRSNHLIPLVPWLALAGIAPVFVLALALIDFVSSGLYLGDLWLRYYPALAAINDDARATGEWLINKPGTLYMNGIHSAVYIYARKPLTLGMTEQIEIREVATERRKNMVARWRQTPPDWVVCGDVPGIQFKPLGYNRVATAGANLIYKKAG